MVNDPETLETLEEAGLKFMPISEYNGMREEIDIYTDINIYHAKKDMEEKTKMLEKLQAEIGPLKEEYEKLLANNNLGLEKWCGTCLWGGPGGTCDSRKDYFIATYGHGEVSAKVAVMKQSPKCKGE